MSVHLDTPGVWEPGRSYEIPIKPRLRQAEGEGYYTQLTLHISLVRGEDSWDGEADLLALASQPQGAGSGWALAGGGVSYPGPPCSAAGSTL